ncbi:unnamed protein product, partial [Mesorhabditis belari]|uniref:Uncharacterized protein n=1 Tax=Mesorhabditis belari TaxID=2138241 RepID=A0AAF3EG42_9BILA
MERRGERPDYRHRTTPSGFNNEEPQNVLRLDELRNRIAVFFLSFCCSPINQRVQDEQEQLENVDFIPVNDNEESDSENELEEEDEDEEIEDFEEEPIQEIAEDDVFAIVKAAWIEDGVDGEQEHDERNPIDPANLYSRIEHLQEELIEERAIREIKKRQLDELKERVLQEIKKRRLF